MALVAFQRALRYRNGNVVTGASMYVRVAANPPASGALATVYEDDAGATPLTQPLSPNADGEFVFYIAQGRYDLTVSGNDLVTKTYADVAFTDPDAAAAVVTDGDYGDVVVSGVGTVWTVDALAISTGKLAANAATNAKLAQMNQATIKGRASGAGTGDPVDLTATQATAILNQFAQDLKGLAPGPTASEIAAGEFLKADGTWATPTGTEDLIEGLVYNHRRSPLSFSSTDLSSTATLTPTLATQVVCVVNGHMVTKAVGTALTFAANESGGVALDVQEDGTLVYYKASDYGGIVPEVATTECRICTVFTGATTISSVLDSGLTEPKLQENPRRVPNALSVLDSLLITAAGTGTDLSAGGLRQAAGGKVDWYFINQGLRFFVKERPWMVRRYLDLYLSLLTLNAATFKFRIANYVEDPTSSGNFFHQGRHTDFVGSEVSGTLNGAGTVFTRSAGAWTINELVGQYVCCYLNSSVPSPIGSGTWKEIVANDATTFTVSVGFTNTFNRARVQGYDSDSDDSYTASLCTLVRACYDADPAFWGPWLIANNATHSLMNWQVLAKSAYYNLTTRMYSSGGFNGLVKTFQDDYNPTGYGLVAQTMDNCEAGRGLADLAFVLRQIGEPSEAAYYDSFANLNGNGLGVLFVTSDGQNASPPNAVGETTYNAFATRTYRTGTAAAGGASSITLDAGASNVTDEYKGMIVRIVSGTGQLQFRRITAYNGTTKVATVGLAWGTVPNGTSVFVLIAGTRKLGTDTYPAIDPGLYPGATANVWPTLFDPPNIDQSYRNLAYTRAQYTAAPGAEQRRYDFSPWLNMAYACIVKGEFEKALRWMMQYQRYNDPDNTGRYTLQDLGYWKACVDHFGPPSQNDARVLDLKKRFDGTAKGPFSAVVRPDVRIVSSRKEFREQLFGPVNSAINVGISAASTTRLLAATNLVAGAVTEVRTFAAQPDAPRVCRIVASGADAATCGNGAYSGVGSAVVIIGGYCFGVWQVDVIALNGATAVNGKFPFDEIVYAKLPEEDAASTQLVSIGCGDVFGLDAPPPSATDLYEFARKASAATSYTVETLPSTTDLGEVETYLSTAGGIIGASTSFTVGSETGFPAIAAAPNDRFFIDVYHPFFGYCERMLVTGLSPVTVVRDVMGEGGKTFPQYSRVRLVRGNTFASAITANDRLRMAYRTRREL